MKVTYVLSIRHTPLPLRPDLEKFSHDSTRDRNPQISQPRAVSTIKGEARDVLIYMDQPLQRADLLQASFGKRHPLHLRSLKIKLAVALYFCVCTIGLWRTSPSCCAVLKRRQENRHETRKFS